MIWATLCLCAVIGQLANAFSTDWSDEFEYSTYIDENQLYKLYWTNLENENIEFGIEVQAVGWIALGISPRAQMINSDIAIGWVDDDGNTYLQDRYTNDKRVAPFYDHQQNLTLISGEQVDGMTRIRFIRPKYSCDHDDVSVSQGTTRLIWAFHSTTDPLEECFDSNSINIHTNWGSQSINLHSGSSPNIEIPDDTKYVDILMDNVNVPATDTTYYCKLLAIPQLNQTQYIIKMDTIVEPGNEGLVHHLIAYYCPEYLVPNKSHIGTEGVCDEWDTNMPSIYCRGAQMVYLWAIGGNAVYMPENVAMPISGDSGLHYFLLEMHYDNPLEKSGLVDSSGFRIFYQSEPRQYDVGILTVGLDIDSYGQWIPPGLNAGHHAAFVPSDCSQEGIPEQGIKVFASILHQHTIGTALILRHIRNGQELEPIDINLNYDFNYQQFIYLDEELVLLPGDEFILDCYVNSTNRDFITTGGESTRQEMCFAFLYYYPAMEWQGAVGSKSPEILYQFLVDANENGYLESNIEEIDEAFSTEIFDDLVWNKEVDGAEEFYNRLYSVDYPEYNQHHMVCFGTSGFIAEFNVSIERNGEFEKYDITTIECNDEENKDETLLAECVPHISMSTTIMDDSEPEGSNAVIHKQIFAFVCVLLCYVLK